MALVEIGTVSLSATLSCCARATKGSVVALCAWVYVGTDVDVEGTFVMLQPGGLTPAERASMPSGVTKGRSVLEGEGSCQGQGRGAVLVKQDLVRVGAEEGRWTDGGRRRLVTVG